VNVHPLPKQQELFATSAGGQRFSIIDLSHAYQLLMLDDNSRELVTINTHRGLHRYTRLPFVIPAVFQCFMDKLLGGIPNVTCYVDDIFMMRRNDTEHLRTLEEV
jgi:hypothetical protein